MMVYLRRLLMLCERDNAMEHCVKETVIPLLARSDTKYLSEGFHRAANLRDRGAFSSRANRRVLK